MIVTGPQHRLPDPSGNHLAMTPYSKLGERFCSVACSHRQGPVVICCLKRKVLQHPRASRDYNPWALGSRQMLPRPIVPGFFCRCFCFSPPSWEHSLFCSLMAAVSSSSSPLRHWQGLEEQKSCLPSARVLGTGKQHG